MLRKSGFLADTLDPFMLEQGSWKIDRVDLGVTRAIWFVGQRVLALDCG
ncbi:MAG TPA: hypothetical protein VFU69_04140 [Ktedonobacterales bacterium]|nr:hypothetical protein [Ktedonobacterales bacterium]